MYLKKLIYSKMVKYKIFSACKTAQTYQNTKPKKIKEQNLFLKFRHKLPCLE